MGLVHAGGPVAGNPGTVVSMVSYLVIGMNGFSTTVAVAVPHGASMPRLVPNAVWSMRTIA
jgi:hypothetical protein